MKNKNLTTQCRVLYGEKQAGAINSDRRIARGHDLRMSPPRFQWKKITALLTVVIFAVFTIAPSWAVAETINLEGGSVEVSTQDNTTNWNVSGNPVWNVPEFNIAQNSIYNVAGLGQGASLALLVNGGQPSNIFGTLNLSNLAFILQNIAGINIGSTGAINLNNASLLASTLPLNLDVTDFLAKDYQFSGQGGFLMNEGKITGNQGDLVALIANAIENRGVIDVPSGTVALAGGNVVTIGISGDGLVSIGVDEATANDMGLSAQIRNTGTISSEGGRVILNAQALDGLFEKAISLEQDGNALSAIKARNGTVEFVSYDDFYNSSALSAVNGHVLVDSKGNITNEGVIDALNGTVELTAKQSVYNKSLIEALGGKVDLTAEQGEVKNTGTIDVKQGALEIMARDDVMNEALMKAVEGEINMTSREGAIKNKGTLDATQGHIEMQAAEEIETTGVLKAETFQEKGATFRLGGTYSVGTSYHDNLDGALKMIPGDTGGPTISGNITDAGDIVVTDGTAVVLSNNTNIIADSDVNGTGFFQMGAGSSITGNGHNLSIKAGHTTGGNAFENRLRAIDDIGILDLQASTVVGGTPVYYADPSTAAWTSIDDFRITSGRLNRFTGAGTAENPYAVYDIYGLQALNGYLGVDTQFELMNDLDASVTAAWNGGLGFKPIGTSTGAVGSIPTASILGGFDGLNHMISNLTINRPTENYVGLFGATTDMTIKNLGLVDASIVGQNNVGALVGYNYRSLITDTYATGTVTGSGFVGGLTGLNYQASTIMNSYASTDVTATGLGAGGLVGYNFVSTVENSYSTGLVGGGGSTQGGLIGKYDASTYVNNWWWKDAGHNPGLMDTGQDDVTDDKIAVEDTLADFYVSTHQVYAATSTEGWDFDVEWLAGGSALPEFGINPNTYLWTGSGLWSEPTNWSRNAVPGVGDTVGFNGTSILDSNMDAGFGGVVSRIKIKDTYAGTITQNRSLNVTTSYVQEGGTFVSDPSGQIFTATSFSVPGGQFNRFSGLGTEADPYLIHDIYGLQGIKGYLASGTYLKLAQDIDLTDARFWNYKGYGDTLDVNNYLGFDPIGNKYGNFSGDFDGDRHVISNLRINRPNMLYVGLFGRTSSASVHDVGLEGGSVLGGNNVGSLVGYNYESAVRNSYSTVDVSGYTWVGGLVGTNDKNAIISKSYATGDVANISSSQSDRGAGGLLGFNYDYSEVEYSYATGAVSGYSDVGGLVGANENLANISYSYSKGSVALGGQAHGGLVGWFYSGVATRNYWDTQTSGWATSSGQATNAVEGKTTAQMKQMTTFSGWDPGVWGLQAGITYPELAMYHTQWTGAGGDANWSTAANWATWNAVTHQYDSIVPDADTLVFFNDLGAGHASNIDAGFAGTVGYLGVGSGYANTLTQNIALLTPGDFAQGGGTFNGGSNTMDLNGFVLNGGTFTAPSTINVDASWVRSGGTYAANGGLVNFGGTTNQTITSSGMSFNNVTVDRSGTLTLNTSLTAAGELLVTSGTLDANLQTISEGGNWIFNNLTNLKNITLTGAGKTITSGGTEFPTLSTLTISGSYALQDAIVIQSALSVPGTLNANNQTMTFERNVDITNVSNINYLYAQALTVVDPNYDSFKSGGSSIRNLYVQGRYQLSDALSITNNLSVSGALNVAGQQITSADSWSFSNLSNLGPVVLTGSGSINTANAAQNIFGNLTISGNYWLSNTVHIDGLLTVQTGGSLNANGQDMSLARSLDMTRITNTSGSDITLDGSGSITSFGKQVNSIWLLGSYWLVDALHVAGAIDVWTHPQAPGVPVRQGSLNAANQSITTGGSLDLTTMSNIRDVTLDGSGSFSFISAGKTVNDFTVSGTSYALSDALHVNGALSVTGSLNANTNTMTLAQGFDLTKISNATNIVLDGSAGSTYSLTSASKQLQSLDIQSGKYSLTDALFVNTNFTLAEGVTLDAASKPITVGDDLDLTYISNPYDITLGGAIGVFKTFGKELHDVTIAGGYQMQDALHVNGVLNTAAGSLDLQEHALTLAGSLDLTTLSNTGQIVLDGSGTITSAGGTIGQTVDQGLTIKGTYTLVDPLTVRGDLDVQAGGSLDAVTDTNTIAEGGDWSFDRISNVKDVILTGSGKYITSAGNEFDDLTIYGDYTLTDSLHIGGVLTVSNALDAADQSITLNGDLNFEHVENPGDVVLDGSGDIITWGKVLGSLSIYGAYDLWDGLTVTREFAVYDPGSLNAHSNTIVEGGNWTFDRIANYGDVVLTGSGKTIFSDGNTFYDLTIRDGGSYALLDSLHVNEAFDLSSGALNAAGFGITLAQNLDLTNISNISDVLLDGGSGTITSAGKAMNNLTIQGTYGLIDALHVNGDFYVTGGGTLDAGTLPITVGKDLDLNQIINPGNVTLAGTGTLVSASKEIWDLVVTGDYLLYDNVHVNGGFSVTGALDANGMEITAAQDLDLTKVTNPGSLTLDGGGLFKSNGNHVDNLTISGYYELADDAYVDASLNVTGGLNAAGKAMTLTQDFNLANITNAGNVTLTGSGNIISGGKSMQNLTVSNGASYALADALIVNGNINILGTLNAASKDVSVGGDWSFIGNLTNLGGVTLTGIGKTITSGGNQFNNLTITGSYRLVDALSVIRDLKLQGGTLDAAGQSITEGGSWDSNGFVHLGSVTLTGLAAGGGKTITSGGVEFENLTVTGAYALADGLIVAGILDVLGGILNANEQAVSVGGNWLFNNISNVGDVTLTGSGKTITSAGNAFNNLTVSGSYTLLDALTVNGALNVTGNLDAAGQAISLAQDLNITGLENAGDMTLTGSGQITSGGNSFTNLTITGNYTLADALIVVGELDVRGTLDAATYSISEGGNWVFTNLSNYGAVTLTGAGKTITSNSNAFNNLAVTGTYSLVDALRVNGNLSVIGGLNGNNKNITIAHDLNLSKITNAGDMTLTGSGTITSGGNSVQDLTISGAYTLVDALTALGDLSIPGSLNAAFQTVSVSGDWVFLGSLSNLGDVILTGTNKTITSGGNEFNNLTIAGLYSLVDALHVNGALDVSGTLDAASKAMTIGGDFNLGDILNPGNVTLDGVGEITSGGRSFANLTITGAYALADALIMSGALNLTGTLNAANQSMTFAQSLDLTKIANARDVTLTGSGSINAAGKSVNNLTISGTYTQASDLAMTGDFTVTSSGSFTDASPLSHAFSVAGDLIIPYGTNAFRRYTGSGTAGDPFAVRTVYDLQGMKGNLASYFILADNLDLSGVELWNSGAGFDPIGNAANPFTGYLNGNSKVISNLSLSRTGSDYQGLFGNIGAAGSVTNLGLEKVSIGGKNYVGGLVGLNAGSLTNVYTTGMDTVTGTSYVGGLAGSNTGSITNAYSAAKVMGTDRVGGLVGSNTGSITNTYAMGHVTGTSNTGGLVGAASGPMTSSYWDINATGQAARGVANEGTGLAWTASGTSMMNQGTYTGWDFTNTWVMDEGGSYPHFQFRYPAGVRGIWGNVYSSEGVLAGSGTSVSIYLLPAGSSTETYLDAIVTDASSRYYIPLAETSIDNEDSIVSYSLSGSSRMPASSGSLYPLYVVNNQNLTLAPPTPGPGPTPDPSGGGSVPLPPLPSNVVEVINGDVTRTLVDSAIIPVLAPVITTPDEVEIIDQTYDEELEGIVSFDFEMYNFDWLFSSFEAAPPVTRPVVFRPSQNPVVPPAVFNQANNGLDYGADISVVMEAPLGQEPVLPTPEFQSPGTNPLWRGEQGARETSTYVWVNGSGSAVEEITTDILLNNNGSYADTALLNSFNSSPQVEEISTDIQMEEGGLSSFGDDDENYLWRRGQGFKGVTANVRVSSGAAQ
jgi:hypothetical protein